MKRPAFVIASASLILLTCVVVLRGARQDVSPELNNPVIASDTQVYELLGSERLLRYRQARAAHWRACLLQR
jgi:hypothetical protein